MTWYKVTGKIPRIKVKEESDGSPTLLVRGEKENVSLEFESDAQMQAVADAMAEFDGETEVRHFDDGEEVP